MTNLVNTGNTDLLGDPSPFLTSLQVHMSKTSAFGRLQIIQQWVQHISTYRPNKLLCLVKTSFEHLQVETEELIYPWQSLVAEFGGALGLFLGFSFMTIWDLVIELPMKLSIN